MTYNIIIKRLDIQLQRKYELKDKGQLLLFFDITDHSTTKGTNYSYEVLVNRKDGHVTWEPLSVTRRNGPIYLAKYARENYLPDNPGWNQRHCYAKNTKNTRRLLKSSKAKKRRNTVKIKSGMNISRDHKESIIFDDDNGNTNWKDAELLELKQIYNFNPFNSLWPVTSACILPGHNKIQVHIIYDYKQYGRYKANMLYYVNMNGPNLDTYYSSAISLRSMRTFFPWLN